MFVYELFIVHMFDIICLDPIKEGIVMSDEEKMELMEQYETATCEVKDYVDQLLKPYAQAPERPAEPAHKI